MSKHVTAVAFDLDGLMVDTEKVYDRVIQAYAQKMTGQPIAEDTFQNMRARMFGRKPEDAARLLHETLKLDSSIPPEDYLEWRKPILDEEFPKVDLLPGAARLVQHLASSKVPIAIATSSQRWMIELKLQRHPEVLAAFVGNIIAAEDVKKGKPDPEMFLQAAERLGTPAAECLVFEDAPNGVQAARAGNMPVVAVPHPLLRDMPEEWAIISEADQVLASLEEFDPAVWGLPAYEL